MDPIIEQIVASICADVHESFLAVPVRNSMVSNLKPVPSKSPYLLLSFEKLEFSIQPLKRILAKPEISLQSSAVLTSFICHQNRNSALVPLTVASRVSGHSFGIR